MPPLGPVFSGRIPTGAPFGPGASCFGGQSPWLDRNLGAAQSEVGMGCFSCNAAIELAAGERVGFRDTCEACDSDLHVCLNCIHYDSNAYNQCREPNAEWVSERERANRCDYFAYGDRLRDTASAERARTSLDDLFKKP